MLFQLRSLEPDSGNPPAVTVTLNGNLITWTKSNANDVIGYRVYDVTNGERNLVATIKDGQELNASVDDKCFLHCSGR